MGWYIYSVEWTLLSLCTCWPLLRWEKILQSVSNSARPQPSSHYEVLWILHSVTMSLVKGDKCAWCPNYSFPSRPTFLNINCLAAWYSTGPLLSQSLTSCTGTHFTWLQSTGKELWERNWHLFIGMQQPSFHILAPTTSRSFLLPVQEAGRSHPLVTLMKECLANNPESHPKASELVSQLRIMSPELPPPPPFTPFQESSIIKFSLKSIQP